MSTVKIAILECLFLFVTSLAGGADWGPFVYRLTVRHGTNYLCQTAFRLKGTTGLITALHGVLDADDIIAENKSGELIKDLMLFRLNRRKDLALVNADELDPSNTKGLEMAQGTINEGADLLIPGCPQGVLPAEEAEFKVGRPSRTPISTCVPASLQGQLDRRRSPDGEEIAIKLRGAIGPGYSGAPVMNANGNVIGIADGGLALGYLTGWAIPIANIDWRNPNDTRSELRELARIGRQGLFNETITEPIIPPLESDNALSRKIETWKKVFGDGNNVEDARRAGKGFERIAQAAREKSTKARAYYYWGMTLEAQQDPLRPADNIGLDQYSSAITSDPSYGPSYLGIAQINLRLGRDLSAGGNDGEARLKYHNAISYANRCVELVDPVQHEILHNAFKCIAEAYKGLGDFEKAGEFLNRAKRESQGQ